MAASMGLRNTLAATACCLLLGLFFTAFFAVFIGIGWSFDATDETENWGGYKHGETYRLNFDVFIIDTSLLGFSNDLALVPAKSVHRDLGRHYSAPSSIAEYETYGNVPPNDRDVIAGINMGPHVTGIARKGTRVKTTRLERFEGWSGWFGWTNSLTVYAEIIDGEFSGSEVDLRDVSIYYQDEPDGIFKHEPEELVFDPKLFSE